MPYVVKQHVDTFAHDGMEFQYLEHGHADGEPIVLLHGSRRTLRPGCPRWICSRPRVTESSR